MKAFSLIELIVVIAVVAILSAIAVPAYKDYQLRASMSRLVQYSESFLNKVKTYYTTKGVMPTPTTLNIGTGNSISSAYWPNFPYISGMRLLPDSAVDFQYYLLCVTKPCVTLVYDFNETPLGTSTKIELWFSLYDSNGVISTKCGLNLDAYNDTNIRKWFPQSCQQIAYNA